MKTAHRFHSIPFLSLVAPLLFLATCLTALAGNEDQQEVERPATDSGSAVFPLETRVAVKTGNDGQTRARVTLFFPNSGYEVTEWGEVSRHGAVFSVTVEAERTADEVVRPVITPISHVYDLGQPSPGKYVFDVWSRGRLLAHESFEVREPVDDPFPGHARLAVHLDDDGVYVEATVRFRERGWRITDWGEPARHGNEWTIHAQAERRHWNDGQQDSYTLREERHRYHLGVIHSGRHHLAFFVNHDPLARTSFTVPAPSLPQVTLQVDPLTENRPFHPLRLLIQSDNAHLIDPDSFADANLRIVGPGGYDTHPEFVDWHPTSHGLIAVRYRAHPPGRIWTARDNGTYRVALRPNSIRTVDGDYLPGQHLGTFDVNIEPGHHHPLPKLVSFVPSKETDNSLVLENTYSGTLTVAFPASNVQVSDWGSILREGRHFRVDVQAVWDGEVGLPVITEKSHSYHLGTLPPGDYAFSLYSRERYMGSVHFSIEGSDLPSARVRSDPIVEPSPHPHLFRVLFHSEHPMDLDSIRETILRVTGPEHFSKPARPLSVQRYVDAEHARDLTIAVYAVEAPVGGWHSRFNGHYSVIVPHHSIRDQAGHYLPGGGIGGFRVLIRDHEPRPGEPILTLEIEEEEGVYFAHVFVDPNGSGWEIVRWGDLRLHGNAFVAPVEIDETAGNLALQYHLFRLGRLQDGHCRFILRGSNHFVMETEFLIGDNPVTPYEQWRRAAEELLEEEGHSVDTITDLLTLREYAFALDPRQTASNPLRLDRQETGGVSFSFPAASAANDISFRIEASHNLRDWTDVTDAVFLRQVVSENDGVERQVIDWPDHENHRFVRVRAVRRQATAP